MNLYGHFVCVLQGLGSSRRNTDWGNFCFSSSRSTHTDFGDDVHLHDIEGGEHSDLTDYDDGLESDYSNLDVIPFSENEYEKITVDIDVQTDELDGKLTPCSSSSLGGSSGKEEGCDMDTGIDSALGRSVSDHSIGEHPPAVYHSNIQLTNDNVDKVVSKAVTFAAQLSSEMKAIPDQSMSPARGKRATLKPECPDVGYSSESHSNDEPESPGADTAHNKQNLNLDEVVLRRKPAAHDGSSDGAENMTLPSSPEKCWRHSMTSAYDTSSNCSELNSPHDLDLTLETSAETTSTVVEGCDSDNPDVEKMQELVGHPSQPFYIMTPGLDTDSESIAARSGAELRSGTTTDVESDLSKSLELAADLPRVIEEHLHSTPIKHDDTPTTDDVRYVKSSQSYVRRDLINQFVDQSGSCLKNDFKVDIDVNRPKAMNDNEDFVNENLEQYDQVYNVCGTEEQPRVEIVKKGSSESIKKLINQAEMLVRDKEIMHMQAANVLITKRKTVKSKRRLKGNKSSVISTDKSELPTEEESRSQISSCDASAEATSEEETESEEEKYSTASSDHGDDHVYTSVTLTNRSAASSVGRSDLSQSEHKQKTMLKRRDRPWSVTEMYELTNRLDLSPFSISESAIDNMHSGSYHKLRRTISDTLPLKRYDSPRKRRRKLRRTVSDETEKSSVSQSQKSFQSAPGPQSCQEWRTQSQSLSSGDKTGTASGSETYQQGYSAQLHISREMPEIIRGVIETAESNTTGTLI